MILHQRVVGVKDLINIFWGKIPRNFVKYLVDSALNKLYVNNVDFKIYIRINENKVKEWR